MDEEDGLRRDHHEIHSSLRSRRRLVWSVVGYVRSVVGYVLLLAAPVIALFALFVFVWSLLLRAAALEEIATASVVGVIVDADDLDRVVVEDEAGRQYQLALRYPFAVWAPWPIGLPEAGDLLLGARFARQEETWFVVAGQTSACRYSVEFYSAWDLEDAIVGDERHGPNGGGIRLPKATGYREEVHPAWNGLWTPYAQFCLNREGEVVSSSSVGVP